MDVVAPEHVDLKPLVEERREGRIKDVEAAGVGTKSRHDEPQAVGHKAAAYEPPPTNHHGGFGV